MSSSKLVTKTATEGLKILWSEGFFQRWKKVSDIIEIFSKSNHHFSDAELGMALKRAKHLTRRGKRRNYEYIQKYPFVEEEKHGRKKRTE